MAEKVKPRIVEAVGASSTVGVAGSGGEPGRPSPASQIQEAMNAAIVECSKKGINDPVKVKAAMMEARERVKKDWAAGEAKVAAEAKAVNAAEAKKGK